VSRSRIVIAVLFCAALLVPTSAAEASSSVLCSGYSSCSDKGYSSYGYSTQKSKSYWRMYTGTNCTNYVAYRLVTTNGMPNTRPKAGVGNAKDWGFAMSSVTNSTPTVGSVAWWGRTGHHVAYVEKIVSSTEIWVSESNWSGAFDWRKITKSGSGWPDGFIHFKDLTLANKAKPAIKGTVEVGGALTVSAGDWSPTGNSYAYQWRADGQSISGAVGKTYTPTADQLGKQLTVSVTASRPGYPTAKADSISTKVAPGTFKASRPPTISGTAQVDSVLTASSGTWSKPDLTYAYQWMRDGVPVPGATASTFTPGPADANHPVTVAVTASKPGYTSTTSTSTPTADVALGVLSGITRPTISGTAKVGSALTASPGTWSKPDLTYTYQWQANGTDITGATSKSFIPTSRERGSKVGVRVYVHKDGYETDSALSDNTAEIGYGTIQSQKAPAVTGSLRVGSTLSVSAGTLAPAGTTVTYQWLRDGKVQSGATGRTRKIPAGDRGHKLSVQVRYSAPGYTTRTDTTASTGVVKTTSKLSVSVTPGSRKVSFKINVTATGISPPNGTIDVAMPGPNRTIKLVKGRATLSLTKQATGSRVYVFTLRGTSSMTSAKSRNTVKIR
jgi:surface antigen